MFRVVTIEREYGCGGAEIGRTIAERLGWTLWDQSLTQEIAKVANVGCDAVERCSERVDSTFRRLVKTFWRGSYERSMVLPEGGEPFGPDRFVAVGEQVMKKIAESGNCVIVGRGASFFLRERHDTFRVFLYAPYAEKLRRLKQAGKGEREAEELLDTVDRDRVEFVRRYFNADWPTRCLYHMMINTAVGNQLVVPTILDIMQKFS